ncbi:hypothetical protein BDF20DRAFT_510115 [Mycotypha africana]|uniref:uncharacterized protein n=1 Tax=Mycotypha africana TaxID=64632 RepID=UPI002300F276|nr:uncharacterized protein BDF20DRAFT_510115 [Mycotypha africana]KAI8979477.1 hypothetical protein BDF20DRAFT_510115 [Mycotypha africana]
MTKETFIMRTKIVEGGECVPSEILDIMYDNIVSSEFTYADSALNTVNNAANDMNHHLTTAMRQERSNSWFARFKGSSSSSSYTDSSADTNNSVTSLCNHHNNSSLSLNNAMLNDLGQKLERLMPAENSFSYKRSLKPIPIMELHFAILKAKTLCLSGVKSKHYHYPHNSSSSNSNTYTIRVTKAAILERKYDLIQGGKRATARSWRSFGVILSGSQIIFFSDVTSFQEWLKSQSSSSNDNGDVNIPPRRNNSYPSISKATNTATTIENSDNIPSSPTLSLSSTTTTMTNISTMLSSTATPNLRPVQIISLSYAICIYDEEYTKYPHVFRLITGDGQQFLFKAENDKDMDDWMLKINYAATLKTTGIKIRSNDGKEDMAKEKIEELSRRIREQVKLLDRELQLRRNLMVLVPNQKSTKDRIIHYADTLGKRIKQKRLDLQRLECYRDCLEAELLTTQQLNSSRRKMSLPLLPPSSSPTSRNSHLYSVLSKQQNSNNTLPAISSNNNTNRAVSNSLFTSQKTTNNTNKNVISDSTSTNISDYSNSHSPNSSNVSGSVSSGSSNVSSLHSAQSEEDKDIPQLPPFQFPQILLEDNKRDEDKQDAHTFRRRRSQSNPTANTTATSMINKLLLSATINHHHPQQHNRHRSASEASSLQVADDEDLSILQQH